MQGVRVQAPAYKVVQSYAGQSDVGDLPLSNSGEQVHCKENRSLRRTGAPLRGVARKAALPMISLSAVGWILFVVGFGIYKNDYLYLGPATDYPELYWAWAASIVGPVAYLLSMIHAVTVWTRASAVLESVIAVLGVVYTTALGYALIACGIFTYEATKYSDPYSKYSHYPEYMGLMFAGSFIACLFWAITQALWPWYTTGLEHRSMRHTADSDHLPLIFEEKTEQV